MAKTWKVRRNALLMGHGALMLCLGMALCSLGSAMSNPVLDELGYAIAVVLTALCLLIPGVFFGVFAKKVRPPIVTYLGVGALSIASWLIFWLIQSAPSDLRFLVLLAGLHGLLWSLWYVKLAFSFQACPTKAALLCVLAATTSFLGIVLATQSQFSKLSAVTAVGCYTLFIGVQILLTTTYLYRSIETQEESLIESGFPRTAVVENSRILIEGDAGRLEAEENRITVSAD